MNICVAGIFLYLVFLGRCPVVVSASFKEVMGCVSKEYRGVRQEIWKNLIVEGTLSGLESDFRYPHHPDTVEFRPIFDDPGKREWYYGQRLTTYFVAPETGNYVFYLSCDDQCKLSISTDHHVNNMRTVAWVKDWTNYRRWKTYPSQQISEEIPLTGGSFYFLQVIMVQVQGLDHVSVGAEFPDGTIMLPLTDKYLVQFETDPTKHVKILARGDWSTCSASCGRGVQTRNNTMCQYPPLNFAIMNRTESRSCQSKPCPGPPRVISTTAVSSFSVTVTWRPEPQPIQGYNVSYVMYLKLPASSRSRRAISHVVSSSGNGHVIVSADVHSVVLLGLRAHRDYCVRVATLTSDGRSITSLCVNVTTEQTAPSAAPTGLSAVNKTSPHKVSVQWGPVPLGDQNGVILGYYIQLYPVSTADEEPRSKNAITIRVLDPEMGAIVPGLQSYTVYSVRVAAFTAEGTGPYSEPKYVETCRCPKRFFTNWWTLPPLTMNATTHAPPQGAFIELLDTFTTHACGLCHHHRRTVIRYDTLRLAHVSAHKPSLSDVRKSIRDTADLSFPMTLPEDSHKSSPDDDVIFVPVMKMTSSIVYITEELSAGVYASAVGSSILQCLPVLAGLCVTSYLVGMIFWFLDAKHNPDLHPSFIKGAAKGSWCAFISTASVGYGDCIPVSSPARVFMMGWIIMGLIYWSIFMSLVTSSLSVSIVMLTKNPESGGKIGVIQGSMEFKVATKINGSNGIRCIGFKTQEEMVANLTTGQLNGVLLDSISAARTDYPLPPTGYKPAKVFDLDYSYGVYLGGDAVKLAHLFKDYLKKHPFVLKTENNLRDQAMKSTLSTTSLPPTEEMTVSFFNPSTPTFRGTLRFSVALLLGLIACGSIYSLITLTCNEKNKTRFGIRANNNNNSLDMSINRPNPKHFRSELRMVVEEFYKNCKAVQRRLTVKHLKEQRSFLHQRVNRRISVTSSTNTSPRESSQKADINSYGYGTPV
ncbi:uncharacterized protein LOC5503808 [Nematostella vectensis]|uniref:uncharacterized protein LOC5503808 n=1 Tax=Nematostella vectensis TaxID=45351 RepID=UPI002076ED9C|nr:uncharacterized protein LOC5503808 [Nematostella vectensis]